jgi:rare lipoprotein A
MLSVPVAPLTANGRRFPPAAPTHPRMISHCSLSASEVALSARSRQVRARSQVIEPRRNFDGYRRRPLLALVPPPSPAKSRAPLRDGSGYSPRLEWNRPGPVEFLRKDRSSEAMIMIQPTSAFGSDTPTKITVAVVSLASVVVAATTIGVRNLEPRDAVDYGHKLETHVMPSPPRGPVILGNASWYGGAFHGRRTANGERFDMHAMTAAHKSLPFGTEVRVTNRENGKAVIVRINDRGPYVAKRIIDLSREAAAAIGMIEDGVVLVKIEVLTQRTRV